MTKIFTVILMTIFANTSFSQVTIGKRPPLVQFSGDNGAKTDGSSWSSKSITGKVYSLFYVDPDEKDANEVFIDKLKAQEFDRNKYGSIAIINLAATWKPNIIIERILKSKQEKYPDTIYVKDRVSKLVKSWGLKDDAYNVLLFNKKGELLFQKAGTMTDKETETYFKLIKENL